VSYYSLSFVTYRRPPLIVIFSTLITDSGESTKAVRLPAENAPIKDVTSKGATCNVNLTPATETVSVAAGSKIGFKLADGVKVYHQGPAAMYLGQAPGKAADWDGNGPRWFKVRFNLAPLLLILNFLPVH
jgi:hypothetical protein